MDLSVLARETLVLGIGNELLSDEGAGVHALNLMQRQYPGAGGLEFVDGGTLSFVLAGWISVERDLIVFDAADMQMRPGAVGVYVNQDMDELLAAGSRSAHEVGLLDLLDIARLTDSLPSRRALVGIQPQRFGWGGEPSAAVRSALPTAVRAAVQLLSSWRSEDWRRAANSKMGGRGDRVRPQSA